MRIVVLAVIAAYARFSASLVVGTWNVAGCIFGWNLGPDGKTLIAVTPGRPATLSGIRMKPTGSSFTCGRNCSR